MKQLITTLSLPLLLIFFSATPLYGQQHHIQHGSNDYIQYWTAFQLLKKGENFYDANALFTEQRKIHPALAEPMRMWNPPWLLLPLAPVLSLDFKLSVTAWFICNLALLLATGFIAARCVPQSSISPIIVIFFSLLFMPAWETVAFGQISILLGFLVALQFYALTYGHPLFGGFALASLSFKPHLFLPLGIAILWWSLSHRQLKFLLATASFFALYLGAIYSISPSAISNWLAALSDPPLHWQVSSFVGILRTIGDRGFSNPLPELVWVIPLLASVATVVWLIFCGSEIQWSKHFIPLLLISLILSPYAWFADQATLIVAQIFIVSSLFADGASKRARFWGIALLIGIQLAINVQKYLGFYSQIDYSWMPFALLIVWLTTASARVRN